MGVVFNVHPGGGVVETAGCMVEAKKKAGYAWSSFDGVGSTGASTARLIPGKVDQSAQTFLVDL